MDKGFIQEIQDQNIPLSTLLRKAKILALQVKDADFLKWIDLELNGYSDDDAYPKYRDLPGKIKFRDPYLGWQPLTITQLEPSHKLIAKPANPAISQIEALIAGGSKNYEMPFSASSALAILGESVPQTEVSFFIDKTALVGILNGVRNTLFDWLLHNNEPKEITFDPKNSSLKFNGQDITISKTKNSDPHYLLTVLFRDKHKIWSIDEIWTDRLFCLPDQEYDPRNDWRKIYNAARSVNDKIAKATTISDFLDTTKAAISISRKYLN